MIAPSNKKPEPISLESATGDAVIVTLSEYERNEPDKGDYLSFDVEVRSRGFAGGTNFWTSRFSFEQFIEELGHLEALLSGEAGIECGWGDHILFSIHFFTYDNLGHLGVRVETAENRRRRSKFSGNRVSVELELEPIAVSKFWHQLRRVVDEAAVRR